MCATNATSCYAPSCPMENDVVILKQTLKRDKLEAVGSSREVHIKCVSAMLLLKTEKNAYPIFTDSVKDRYQMSNY